MKIEQPKDIFTELTEPIVYSPSMFGFDNYTGKGIKVAMVGTGLPCHKDFTNISDFTILSDNPGFPEDDLCYTTMTAGIFAAKGKLQGVTPDVSILPIKATDNKDKFNYPSIIASILWAITKKVDIITICLDISREFVLLDKILLKASENGIIVIRLKNDKDKAYPIKGLYELIYKPDSLTFRLEIIDRGLNVTFPEASYITTHQSHWYSNCPLPLATLGFTTGIIASLCEKYDKDDRIETINNIFSGKE